MLISTTTRDDGKEFALNEAINGSGRTVYHVVLLGETITLHGEQRRRYKHTDRFTTIAEAENWIRWS